MGSSSVHIGASPIRRNVNLNETMNIFELNDCSKVSDVSDKILLECTALLHAPSCTIMHHWNVPDCSRLATTSGRTPCWEMSPAQRPSPQPATSKPWRSENDEMASNFSIFGIFEMEEIWMIWNSEEFSWNLRFLPLGLYQWDHCCVVMWHLQVFLSLASRKSD